MFRELKRTWSHNDLNYIPRFKELFPELKKVSNEDLVDRFIDLGLDFYTEKKKSVSKFNRLTMPFALILMLLMLIFMPLLFLLTGSWKYPLTEKSKILNWFRSLKLI